MAVGPVSIDDVFLVQFVGDIFGQRILLDLTYVVTTAPTVPANVKEFCDGIIDSVKQGGPHDLVTDYLKCLPTTYNFRTIRCQRIYQQRTVIVQQDFVGTGVVTEGGQATNLAACITLRTDKAGRSQVSSKHIGPISTSAADGGFIGDDLKDNLDVLSGVMLEFLSPVAPVGGGLAPCIYHRGQPTPNYDILTSRAVQTTVRVMRRRTVRIGE